MNIGKGVARYQPCNDILTYIAGCGITRSYWF